MSGNRLIVAGMPVLEFNIRFLPVVTTASKVQIRGNAAIFQNTGTSVVILDGIWRIPANGTFQLGDTGSLVGMIVQEFLVTFENTGVQTDRLQVGIVMTNEPQLAHYVDQNSFR